MEYTGLNMAIFKKIGRLDAITNYYSSIKKNLPTYLFWEDKICAVLLLLSF